MELKIFNLQKNTLKEQDKHPDYHISFKTDDNTFVQGGACWKKQDKNGATYLFCKLSDKYVDHTDSTKTRRGWHIEPDEEVKSPVDEQNDL